MSLVAPEVSQRRPALTSGRVAVRVSQLTKSFNVRRGWMEMLRHPLRVKRAMALSDVSFDVHEGEFFGLLGPNGAGKTTLFKILSTLVLPDVGGAVIGGHDVARDAARVRRILAPVVVDERSLNWRLSAAENLRVYAALQGLRAREVTPRVAEVLELVDLADTGNKFVGQFSSGMKQRLLIARALLSRPRVLLLDEPTRALDPISARRLRIFLREELAGRQGCTVLLATHNAEEAIELCDRVAVLNRGQLLRVGSPDSLLEEYRDQDYRIRIRTEDWARFATVTELRLGLQARLEAEQPDWTTALVRIPGGPEAVSEMIAQAVRADVRVASVEPVHLSLADLIERVVHHSDGSGRNV